MGHSWDSLQGEESSRRWETGLTTCLYTGYFRRPPTPLSATTPYEIPSRPTRFRSAGTEHVAVHRLRCGTAENSGGNCESCTRKRHAPSYF